MKGWVKPLDWAGNLFMAAAVLGIAWDLVQRPVVGMILALVAWTLAAGVKAVNAWAEGRDKPQTGPTTPPETAHKDFDVGYWGSDG